jgi:hypothetical protein
MDFQFFEELSREDAETYLQRFLEVEAAEIEETLSEASGDGLRVDFTVPSVAPLLAWLAKRVGTESVAAPDDLPDWITSTRATEFIEFDRPSRRLVLRASFYLGESFVRSFSNLDWGIGHPEFAHQQQPTIRGFRDGMELPVLFVAENTFLRALDAADAGEEFSQMVDAWAHRT